MLIWKRVLLVPFLLTLLIPSSFMPVQRADGSVSIVICTSNGPLEIRIDPATGQPVHEEEVNAGQSCYWNAQRDLATLPEPVFIPLASQFFPDHPDTPAPLVPRQPVRFERPLTRASPFLT